MLNLSNLLKKKDNQKVEQIMIPPETPSKKENEQREGITESQNKDDEISDYPEIPKELFIEEKEPLIMESTSNHKNSLSGIDLIYLYLEKDFETKGYNDAIVNEDLSNKENGIRDIKLNLSVIMDREINNLQKFIEDLHCEIEIRSKAGLIDLVSQLESKKRKAEMDISKINEIREQMKNNSGLFERVLLSYSRGFNRGLTAITLARFR